MTDFNAKSISQQINRIMINNLSVKYNHLMECELDVKPRVEAFWFFAGFNVPDEVAKSRRSRDFLKEFENEPVNQPLQYYGSPLMHLRYKLPLKEISTQNTSKQFHSEIPVEALDPRSHNYYKELKRATVIPGFWPGDPSEFGFVSYNSTAHLATRKKTFNDNSDAVTAQAVMGSYAWLYSQACYQGINLIEKW